MSCAEAPSGIVEFTAVTEIDTSCGGVTVKFAVPVIAPAAAWIPASPCAIPVARPVAFTAATAGFEELQFTVPVMFCVVRLLNVPVAVNGCERPATTEALPGVTAIETSAGAATVSDVVPLIEPTAAETVVVPCATVLAVPFGSVEGKVAMAGAALCQTTKLVRFRVVLLL